MHCTKFQQHFMHIQTTASDGSTVDYCSMYRAKKFKLLLKVDVIFPAN